MHVRTMLVTTVVVCTVGVAARAAVAQDESQDAGSQARAQLEIAERAFNEQRFRDAVAAYLAADRLQPSPASQLALGKAYDELNDPSRALASYREYGNRAPRADDRAQVQARIAALALQLAERGVQQVSVSSEPAGAAVMIDSKPIGITPIYVDLLPGQHHLEFYQQGYQSAALDFELSARQPLNVMTTLVPLRAGAEPAPLTSTPAATEAPAAERQAEASANAAPEPTAAHGGSPTAADARSSLLRTIGFAALGSSVAALGGAVSLELMRSQSESRARQQTQQIAFARTLDTMRSQQTVARVFAVSAGVLAAAGGVLFVLAIQGTEDQPNSSGVAWACLPSGCQAAVQGHF